jgi:hypothetical protein
MIQLRHRQTGLFLTAKTPKGPIQENVTTEFYFKEDGQSVNSWFRLTVPPKGGGSKMSMTNFLNASSRYVRWTSSARPPMLNTEYLCPFISIQITSDSAFALCHVKSNSFLSINGARLSLSSPSLAASWHLRKYRSRKTHLVVKPFACAAILPTRCSPTAR